MPEPLDIYIVEDDDDARKGLCDILELDEHRVRAFSTAAAMMAHDGFRDVDVVIMDRKLPDGLAEEILPNLKPHANKADFIVITGYADMHAAIAALREGVSDYLIKPIDPDALRATLAQIAKRRAVERDLYRQRRFAEKLLETAEAIILVLNPQGKILRANRHLLELTGYTLEEVAGVNWFEKFIPAADRKRIRKLFAETVQQSKTRGILNPICTKDGRECEVRWSNSTLRNSQGETTAILSVGLDVTDYMKAQRQVLQNERLAGIGQTMTGLAHESRNALQRMQNAIELLQEELAGQPQALADLAKIERAGCHIRDLLEEVRAYAAPINLSLGPESIPATWRRAWESLAHQIKDRDVMFTESITDSEGKDKLVQRVDARRLEQVFRNLLENALQATNGPLRIELQCAARPEAISIVVKDNGPGVPASHRDNIFEAFATTKPSGTGLGLAICKRTVEAHGGTLQLLPSDSGAAFLIELPRRK